MPKKRGPKPKPVNPFEIKNDLEFSGNRSDATIMTSLIDQMVKLSATDRRESLNIPLTVCPNRGSAGNLFSQARKSISESKIKGYKDMAFTSRGIFSTDKEKSYLGSRIWRIK